MLFIVILGGFFEIYRNHVFLIKVKQILTVLIIMWISEETKHILNVATLFLIVFHNEMVL